MRIAFDLGLTLEKITKDEKKLPTGKPIQVAPLKSEIPWNYPVLPSEKIITHRLYGNEHMAKLVTWECLLVYKYLETSENCLTHNQNTSGCHLFSYKLIHGYILFSFSFKVHGLSELNIFHSTLVGCRVSRPNWRSRGWKHNLTNLL